MNREQIEQGIKVYEAVFRVVKDPPANLIITNIFLEDEQHEDLKAGCSAIINIAVEYQRNKAAYQKGIENYNTLCQILAKMSKTEQSGKYKRR